MRYCFVMSVAIICRCNVDVIVDNVVAIFVVVVAAVVVVVVVTVDGHGVVVYIQSTPNFVQKYVRWTWLSTRTTVVIPTTTVCRYRTDATRKRSGSSVFVTRL